MPPKSSSRKKYGRKSSQKVKRAMHEMKRGKLKSGRSGKKVKSRKQAIAIGLSEARRSRGKVPPRKKKSRSVGSLRCESVAPRQDKLLQGSWCHVASWGAGRGPGVF